jgi:glc operon protein GlcG
MRHGALGLFTLALVALMAAGASSLEAQEALTLEQAQAAVDAAQAEASANGWNLTILVTDAEGVPIYLRRMDGAPVRTYDIATRKVTTVLGSGMATGDYAQALQAGSVEEVPNGVTFEGGYPIRVDGEIVGAMTASGARGSEDAQAVRSGLAAIGIEP